MKVCFIGGCGHARETYRRWAGRPDVQLCGFARWSAHEQPVSPFEGVAYFDDALQMLDSVRPDMAVVAPVFAYAADAVLACAARGIDVLCEKPVATDLDTLARIERAVKESGIRFCAMHELRFFPAFFEGARLIREGAVGAVRLITAQKSYKFGTHRPAWYAERALYGGSIPWVGIHAIDWIYHFTGKRFLNVTAYSDGKSPERAALCQFVMEDGVCASLALDYYRPRAANTHGDDRVRVVGDRGVLEIREERIFLTDAEAEREISLPYVPDLWDRFISGEQPITAKECIYLTKVALLAREAADTGRRIEIKE